MTDKDDCTNTNGGEWPKEGPWFGGPFPTRTWSRFIPQCPDYTKYTQEQLDMRRKAEVLQYKNTRAFQTKKMRYAYLAKQNTRTKLYGSTATLSGEKCIKSTRDSDVPGPAIDLYLDPKVPLFTLIPVRKFANSGSKISKTTKLPTDTTS